MKNTPMFQKVDEDNGLKWTSLTYGHCNRKSRDENETLTFDGEWSGGFPSETQIDSMRKSITCREYAACPEKDPDNFYQSYYGLNHGYYEIKDSRISKSCEPFPGFDSGTKGCKRNCYCLNVDHSKTLTIIR